MKFVYPDISRVFDTGFDKVNTLIIENQTLFYDILSDMDDQLKGLEGKSVISEGDKVLPTMKCAELLDRFIPFELSKKALINKVEKILSQKAVNDEFYLDSMGLISSVEKWLYNLSFDLNCDIGFEGICVESLIKASGIAFREEYDSLCEKIIDYIELVTELERQKLFITVNLRSFVSDEETEKFLDSVISHCYNIIMIESGEHKRLANEERYIVDSALCEIG